jgi:hypothetical protein
VGKNDNRQIILPHLRGTICKPKVGVTPACWRGRPCRRHDLERGRNLRRFTANLLSKIQARLKNEWQMYGCYRAVLSAWQDPMSDTYTPSAELRLKAEACHRAALLAEDDETRATFLSLMAAWREIAEQVGRVEQADRSHRRSL